MENINQRYTFRRAILSEDYICNFRGYPLQFERSLQTSESASKISPGRIARLNGICPE
jgi:hypothetical protein